MYQKFGHKGTALSQEVITQRLNITELEPWRRQSEMSRMFTSQAKTSETIDRFSVLLRLTGTNYYTTSSITQGRKNDKWLSHIGARV